MLVLTHAKHYPIKMRMSDKRIELPAESFLLFAKLLLYCIKNKPDGPFKEKIEELSVEIQTKLDKDREGFLFGLGKEINCSEILKGLYGKINTNIRKRNEPFIHLNPSSKNVGLYQYIRDAYPNDAPNKLLSFFSDFVNTRFSKEEIELPTVNKKPSNTVEKEKSLLDDFYNTIWYVYLQTYDDSPKTKYSVISRPVLRIINANEVYLYSSKEEHDFVGKIAPVSFSYNSIIIIDLEKQYSKYTVKKLQFRIALDDVLHKEAILLGQYSYFESSNEMICGTIVMEKYLFGHHQNLVDHSVSKVKTDYHYYRYRGLTFEGGEKLFYARVVLSYWSGWECFIPRLIAEYLAGASENFISTHQLDSLQMTGLKTLLKERKETEKKEEKFNSIIEYDCFLITPIGSLTEVKGKNYYKDINRVFFKTPNPNFKDIEIDSQVLYETPKHLQSINLNRIYYSPRIKIILDPDSSSDGDSQSIIEADFAALKKSRYVIVIAPDHTEVDCAHTSIWIKVGWAMKMNKTVLVFPLAPSLLPKLLNISRIKDVRTFHPVSIDEIPNHLKSDCTDLHPLY